MHPEITVDIDDLDKRKSGEGTTAADPWRSREDTDQRIQHRWISRAYITSDVLIGAGLSLFRSVWDTDWNDRFLPFITIMEISAVEIAAKIGQYAENVYFVSAHAD